MRAHVIGAVDRMQDINRGIHLLSMNARIEAARAGAAGAGFGVVGQELTRLSDNMREAATSLIRESQARGADLDAVLGLLNDDVVTSRLCDLAHGAIDIVDRNLYERSCDVRWWATEPAVARALTDGSPEALRHASQRLGQILASYTVYADLVIADTRGQVICNGRPSRYHSVGAQVERTEWFRSAMATRTGREFGFQSVHGSDLVGEQSVLVYSCAVRDPDAPHRPPLGVLGILFKWPALGQTVVEQLPLSEAERARTRACIVDADGRILADTGNERSQVLDFPERQALFRGRRGVVSTRVGGRPVIVCHAASPGYETYRTGWHALLLREAASRAA
nr:MAG: chemotaxis protein [Pseudomonadota bacterium]